MCAVSAPFFEDAEPVFAFSKQKEIEHLNENFNVLKGFLRKKSSTFFLSGLQCTTGGAFESPMSQQLSIIVFFSSP